MTSNIDGLVESLYQAGTQSDEARSKTLDALRALQLRLERPEDIFHRVSYMHLELASIQLAEDLGIFQTLSESPQPMTVADLAAKTGAAPLLTRRILRYLASTGQIQETAQDTFAANAYARLFAQPGYRGLTYHTFHNVGPALQALPGFLRDTKYRDVNDPAKTAAQKAFDTDLPMFSYMPSHPERFLNVQLHMTAHPAPAVPWFHVFPFQESLGGFTGDTVLVDVGGGFGQQCVALKAAFPDLAGKLVVQDLPQTLDHAPALEGITSAAHDFFQEQPIKGARFYYLRNILHDWPDDKAVAILRRLKDALAPGSQIIIDEIVVPNKGAHWHATSLDMIMMSCLGALERTLDDWHALLEAAGLKALRIDSYIPQRQDSIIQAVPI